VIDYLIREYKAGRTPNPDIMCNREVKFGAFYRFAMEHRADYIATGHYAQVEHAEDSPVLLRGIDETKDQSYFLWAVPKEVLAHTLFPLGGLLKEEVRRLAEARKLPNAKKKDSQGICFLGPVSIEEFLRSEVGLAPGKALDEEGNVVGIHNGVIAYTLGERVSLIDTVPGLPAQAGPWFVLKKLIRENELVVGHEVSVIDIDPAVRLTDTNWIASPDTNGTLLAQYRYHGSEVPGSLSEDRNSFTFTDSPKESLASGQSLVIYDGNKLIGGGIIE
jgi:tRNA-specific 2-thiouridylase